MVARRRSRTHQIHKRVMPSNSRAGAPFQSSDVSSQVSMSISSRISLYCHLFTTTKRDADTQRKITTSSAGAPLGSKSHDPFRLCGLNTRHRREGYSSSFTLVQYSLGFCRTQPPCLLCHVQKFFEVFCQSEDLVCRCSATSVIFCP